MIDGGATVWRARLATPLPSFGAAMAFAALVTGALRLAWDPPLRTYVEYVPIGAVFAGLLWDRLFPDGLDDARAAYCDLAIVTLAAMRAVVPPLPFVSGHTFLSAYAAITARHAPLRIIALLVLAQVMYDKLFVSGGAVSMVAALVVAAGVAGIRRRYAHDVR